jgi:hypothetical protein
MDIIVLDHELASGKVSLEAFKALWEAECYGTATPMQWLEARLLILEHAAISGKSIKVTTPSSSFVLEGKEQFYVWCKASFRDAYACFFEKKHLQHNVT